MKERKKEAKTKKEKNRKVSLKSSSNNSVSPNNLSPTFCVAMLKNGSTIKLEEKAEDFLKTTKDADFAWINVQVDDLKGE